jgi:hypothetical protein
MMVLVNYPEKNLMCLSSTDGSLLAKACDAYLEKSEVARSEELTTVVSAFLTAFQSLALMLEYEFRITPSDQEESYHAIMEAKV